MREGEVIAGRYRVVRRAGSGAMATVYEARDCTSGAAVAVKTLRGGLELEGRARSRLLREAQALAEVRHPAVVEYVDHGVEGESPFLVMAWVEGVTLAERLDEAGMTPVEALALVARLADGLSAAHARGVVHRDLKPGNVMLPGGRLKEAVIVDFGVARLAETLGAVTMTGDQVGTPRYMAPEQIRSARTVDPRGDVFALGCILFECLTGRPAFEGTDPVTVLARILFEPLPAARAIRPELPPSLEALAATLMQRDVARRPSASAVHDEVRAMLERPDPELAHLGRPPPASSQAGVAAGLSQTVSWQAGALGGPPSFHLGANALRTAVRRALPPQATPLVGREDECRHLVALLAAGTPITTVWGGPGMGKTRLAIEAVQRVAAKDDPPWDALVYADLSEARAVDDVLRAVTTAAAVSLESSPSPEVALGRALGKLGRVLLLLDPIEHLTTAMGALVRAFGHEAPGLRVLATSRRRWAPPGAIAVELGPLSTRAPPGGSSPAAALLVEHARLVLPGFDAPSSPEAKDQLERAERVASALEGIPLALELAVASLPVLGFDGLLARLAVSAEPGTSAPPPVRAPMRRVLEGSWALLAPGERRALAQCAVFRGGFTAEAAEAVVEGAADAPPVVALLHVLREHSLIYSRPSDGGEVRLGMFAPVRDFARQKLEEDAAAAGRALRRHAAHFGSVFERPGGAPARARVEREAENLFAAAEYALSDVDGRPADGMRALIALEAAFSARAGAALGYRDLLDRALARAEEGSEDAAVAELAMRVRQIRARLDAPAGRLERARADLEACLADAVARGDARREGLVWLDLGVAHHFARAWAEARPCYDAALERLRGADDPGARGRCYGNLGALAHDEGDFGGAARLYRRAIALLEQAGEERQRANFIANLALLEQELGHLDEARALFESAITLLEPIRDARVLAIALGNRGALELELGFADRALALHERCLGLLGGSGYSRALCLARIAASLATLGRAGEAEARLDQAEAGLAEGDDPAAETVSFFRAFVDLAAAREALQRGDRAAALGACDAVRARLERAEAAREGDHALRERSDDLRFAMRVVRAQLGAVESRGAAEPGAGAGEEPGHR